jgi:hypothetical protein
MSTPEFPIQTKKKLRVIIGDHFEPLDVDQTAFRLSQLDAAERNERDIRQHVESGAPVTIPHVNRMPESRQDFLKAGITAPPPSRAFRYDSDHFEPLRYFANATDLKWIEKFNSCHKFLCLSVPDFEDIIQAIENIVKDAQDEPKLSRLLLLLPGDSPPLAVVSAVYEYWQGKDKMFGSAIRFREWPPEHVDLRTKYTGLYRNLNKARKGMSDSDYLKKLLKELHEIQRERKDALDNWQKQRERQIEDERFVRKTVRTMSAAVGSAAHLLLPPTPRRCEADDIPPPAVLRQATLPQPPTSPAFLKWLLKKDF